MRFVPAGDFIWLVTGPGLGEGVVAPIVSRKIMEKVKVFDVRNERTGPLLGRGWSEQTPFGDKLRELDPNVDLQLERKHRGPSFKAEAESPIR